MSKKEIKVANAKKKLSSLLDLHHSLEEDTYNLLKEILKGCEGGMCRVSDEYAPDNIFCVNAEPEPNHFCRVGYIRYNESRNEIQVHIDDKKKEFDTEDGWINIRKAYVADLSFLVSEIHDEIEYADGYCDE